jgi:hypothetical protein
VSSDTPVEPLWKYWCLIPVYSSNASLLGRSIQQVITFLGHPLAGFVAIAVLRHAHVCTEHASDSALVGGSDSWHALCRLNRSLQSRFHAHISVTC